MVQRKIVHRQRIGPAIRRRRLDRGLTLDDLAAQAEISASHLSRLERSQTLPSFTVLAKIAEALDVGVDEFVQLERDVTQLDAELRVMLDHLGLPDEAAPEFFEMTIEGRQGLMGQLRQLSDSQLTPLSVQENAANALRDRGVPSAWSSINRLIQLSGMHPPAYFQCLTRLSQTAGERWLLLGGRSLALSSSGADAFRSYAAIFPNQAIGPSFVEAWKSIEWLRDASTVRPCPTRIVANRDELLQDGGGSHGSETDQTTSVAGRLADQLESDSSFEVYLTDEELPAFNILSVAGQATLLERLPSRRARESNWRAGLWLGDPECSTAFENVVRQQFDDLASENQDRQSTIRWLRDQASLTVR